MIQFNNFAVFVLNSDMFHQCENIQPSVDDCFPVRMNLEGSNVNTLGVSLVEPVPYPHFYKIEDSRFGSKSLSCMIEPVLGFNGDAKRVN